MQKLREVLPELHEGESGATATEYIILLILIACFVIGIVQTFGKTIKSKYDAANNAVDSKVNVGGGNSSGNSN